MVRPAANTRSIDDLPLTRFHGDVFDTATVAEAMAGCDDVYYCVVDTRAWLRDPSPLFRTNVAGLRNVLDVATDASLRRFVFTSSYATVGRRRGHVATEDRVDTRKVTPYVRSRVAAEDLVLQYAHDAGLPAVAMCVDNLRRRRLGPHPTRRLHRGRGVRQAAFHDARHPAGGGGCRRCCEGADLGGRTRAQRRTVPSPNA